MSLRAARPRLSRRPGWAFVAFLLLSLVAAGLLFAVRAEQEPAPVVMPYDPLPRW